MASKFSCTAKNKTPKKEYLLSIVLVLFSNTNIQPTVNQHHLLEMQRNDMKSCFLRNEILCVYTLSENKF